MLQPKNMKRNIIIGILLVGGLAGVQTVRADATTEAIEELKQQNKELKQQLNQRMDSIYKSPANIPQGA